MERIRTIRETDEDDCIIIHLGHVSEERLKAVTASIVSFMNARWPDVANVGINN